MDFSEEDEDITLFILLASDLANLPKSVTVSVT